MTDRTPEELNKVLKERCRELENHLQNTRTELENLRNAKARTGFDFTPIVNPENGQVEFYSVVYIISDNNVIPLIRHGVKDENNVIVWTEMQDKFE